MEKINGIPADAPLWRGASYAELKAIIDLLSKASYHYADDSTLEWEHASLAKMQAAAEVNRLKLPASAVENLYRDKPQLFTFHHFLDAVLLHARGTNSVGKKA